MKTHLFLAFLAAGTISGCNSTGNKTSTAINSIKSAETAAQEKVEVSPLEGYFTSLRPKELTLAILDSTSFNKDFHPARTMDKPLRQVDFKTEKAGAIVLPETAVETEIKIDSSYITGKVLHIAYAVKQGTEKRSFTTIPVKLFTFISKTGIDSVSFDDHGVSKKVAY